MYNEMKHVVKSDDHHCHLMEHQNHIDWFIIAACDTAEMDYIHQARCGGRVVPGWKEQDVVAELYLVGKSKMYRSERCL